MARTNWNEIINEKRTPGPLSFTIALTVIFILSVSGCIQFCTQKNAVVKEIET